MNVENNLHETYDKYYKNDISKWRFLGAKDKVKNITELCNNKYDKIIELGGR